jgi:CheY-like chemotaxis protein
MTDERVILLVEDNPTDVRLIRRAFTKASVANRIEVVTDGDLAVAYLAGEAPFIDRRAHPLPGLILLDLKLPKRSGLEVLRWLKTQPGVGRIPVVILTSSRRAVDVEAAYDGHANSYLVKPVQFDELQRMMAAVHGFWIREAEPPMRAEY